MNRTKFMILAALTALAINVQAQTPRDLKDLVGMRASSGERELEDRGYFFRTTLKTNNSSIAYWWSPRKQSCIAASTRDGRYTSIVNQPEKMCDDDRVNAGTGHGTSHGGGNLDDLVGMRASSGERELENLGYRFVNSSKDRDRIWANWWSRSQRKCITVVTMNGRYDAITDTLPADCDRR